MNTQLLLLDVEPLTRNKKSSRKSRESTSTQPWWKLSEEEKQRGIQGVQAIRAILNQSSGSDDLYFARAS